MFPHIYIYVYFILFYFYFFEVGMERVIYTLISETEKEDEGSPPRINDVLAIATANTQRAVVNAPNREFRRLRELCNDGAGLTPVNISIAFLYIW